MKLVIRIGFLASGEGTSIESLVKKIQSKKLEGFEEAIIICDRPRKNAGIYTRANKLGLRIEEADDSLIQLNFLKEEKVNLVLGMGYLKKVDDNILDYFGNRIWNIHPSLLPKYGGKGMYGINVHKAVIESGDKETGVTIHIMDSSYDDGQKLNQVMVPIFAGESPEQLQKRILPFEYALMETTLILYKNNLLPNCLMIN